RLDAGNRALLDLTALLHHLVEQLGVAEGGTLRGEVIATGGGIGVEVLLRQAHFRQILTRGAVRQDGGRGRQVVGRDVVAQDSQRSHAAQGTLARQGAFPIRWTANVGALLTPFVQRADLLAVVCLDGEHGFVDATEMFRLHARGDDGVDLLVARPDVLERDRLAVAVYAENVLLTIV